MDLELILNDLIVYLNHKDKLRNLDEIIVPSFMHRDLLNTKSVIRIKVTVGANFELRFKKVR